MEEHKKIVQRVSDLEAEVRILKQELELLKGDKIIGQKNAERLTAKKEYSFDVDEPALLTEQKVPAIRKKKEMDFEKQLRIWLPRVFMFILLLGVLWGLKVGMEYGIITGVVRIALGYIASAGLYFLGMRYIKRKKNGFGLTLLGGCIALGILTTFAAYYLYGYFNFIIAFFVGIAYIVVGLYLSLQTKSETLTIFSAIAGFLLPFLIQGQAGTAVQFCLYLLLLFASLFYVSLRNQHKYSFYATFLLFHLSLAAYVVLGGFEVPENIIVATALIQHIVLLAIYLKGYIARQVFTETLVYTNFVFALGWIKLLEYTQEIIMFGIFATIYSTLALFAIVRKKSKVRGVLCAVAIFAISVLILAFQTDEMYVKVMLLLFNGAIGIWVGLYYKVVRPVITGGLVYVFTAYATFIAVDFTSLLTIQHIVWIVFLLTMFAIYYSFYRWRPVFVRTVIHLDQSLVVGQLVFLVYLYKVMNVFLLGLNISGQTMIHIQLAILALALGAFYTIRKWQHGRYITHATIIEFLLASFIVLGTGLGGDRLGNIFYFNLFVQIIYVLLLIYLFVSIVKDKFYLLLKVKTSALAVCMQIISFIFLNKWYFSIVWINNWSTEWILLVHTFWLFGFAFLSISLGSKMQWKAVKVLGVVLIGACIIKLFLVDLYSVSIIIRSILFIVVGVAGLLYSRTLWKE
ncbi:DUF2339 domain-containing protein [Sporosarcina sp. PTS2304]|uniref:DUF2339 domain-containing protein n=1 Tax=Sporosarcina sp. PTS2304 TaxID=2283194 RepID=UPI000E0CC33C|nr:DUF2339 domain-containing protein [Sporosarcina sp. PTS2304]AXH99525.1 DUF2339 domain-containing protein [Sporosarcina sp. PTS2304]